MAWVRQIGDTIAINPPCQRVLQIGTQMYGNHF